MKQPNIIRAIPFLVSLIMLLFSFNASAQTLSQLDLNDDLVINGHDVFLLRQCFGASATCNPEADFNDDGTIDFLDYKILLQHYGETVEQADVSINGDTEVTVAAGDSIIVVYSVSLNAQASGSYTLDFSESLAPDDGGLLVSNDAGVTFPQTLTDSSTILVNETLTGVTPGQYTITKTVSLDNPPSTFDFEVNVTVLEPGADNPSLSTPGAEPPGIPLNDPTPVIFSVHLSGTDRIPDSVEIRKLDDADQDLGLIATLNDNGEDPDGVAGDLAYTGVNVVEGTTEGVVRYRAVASFPEGDVAMSAVNELVITDVPIGLTGEVAPEDIIIDPATNTEVVKSQVLAILSEGTTPEQAQDAVVALGYEVLGYDPALNTMLIGVPTDVSLSQAISALEASAAFQSAETNGVDQVSEFTPDDTQYGSQWGFPKSRADEAWVISRGAGMLVGMLDTGADLDHPDLQANLWKATIDLPLLPPFTLLGIDAVDGDFVPEDANGHGTHVAGTIAAVSDNASQVAGMAPNAKVLVIRTLGPGGGSHAQFADGVRRAADMGVKIISYSGGGSHSATKQNAVNYAVGKGVLFIAAAGNDNTSSVTSAYPAAYNNVMAIGSTTSTDGRSGFSNFGNWVSMAAPGSGILSTWLAGGTNTISGTSMATPHVSGAAALVWATRPAMTASQVQDRLEKNAKPLSAALQLGKGRLDVFNAVFNGSFEMGDLKGWTKSGTASSVTALGPLTPQDRTRMAYVSTGPADTNLSTTFTQNFTVQNGVTSIPVQFQYNFVTEEYPEWVGTEFNDCMLLSLQAPDGSIHKMAFESVNSSTFSAIGGISLPGGDDTVGMTGWKTVAVNVPVTQGPGSYRVFITDAGDDIYDSVVLLDDIRFKASVPAVAPLVGVNCP